MEGLEELLHEQWGTDEIKGPWFGVEFMRRLLQVSSRDTVPLFWKSGNFGSASEDDTGCEPATEMVVEPDSDNPEIFVSGFNLVLVDGDGVFGEDESLHVEMTVKDKTVDLEYKSWYDSIQLLQNTSAASKVAKIGGTDYNLYQGHGRFPAPMMYNGTRLLEERGDGIKVYIDDGSEDPGQLSVRFLTVGVHGYRIRTEVEEEDYLEE